MKTKQTKTCISLANGDFFDFLAPEKHKYDIECIAYSLSNQCRYTGHSSSFYSVAEHSVLVSKLVTDPALRLTGLLHDAGEAFVGDVASPLKQLLPDFKRIEESVNAALAKFYKLPYPFPDEIHQADKAAYRTEAAQLTKAYDKLWYINHPTLDIEIKCLSPKGAFREFMNRYEFLTNDKKASSTRQGRTKEEEFLGKVLAKPSLSSENYPEQKIKIAA